MTRSFRMSSPSFLSSPQSGKDCKTSWPALQGHRCPAGVQRLPGEGAHLPDTSWCSQTSSARLILPCSVFEWPCQIPSLSLGPPASCPSQFLLTDGSLLPVRQWDTSYCDPKQTDLPVLGWSSSSGGCSSRSDPQIMSSEAVLAMMMSCYKCVTQLIDIYVHSVIQQTMAGFSLVTSNSKFGLGWHFLFRPFSLQHLPFLQIWSEAFPDMKGDLIFLVQLITPNLNYSLHFFFSFHSPQLHFTLRA